MMKESCLKVGSIKNAAKELGVSSCAIYHRFKKNGIVCVYDTPDGKIIPGKNNAKVVSFEDKERV